MEKNIVAAVDLGASSGRIMVAELNQGVLFLNEVYRFENHGISLNGHIYTDILYLLQEIMKGLGIACKKYPVESLGIDTWGVDFGMLDKSGELMGYPYHYRDSQTQGMPEKAEAVFGKRGVFLETGVQDMWYNTIYQLMGIYERKPRFLLHAGKILTLSDLLCYFLTGNQSLEYTIVSTTQMYDLMHKTWSQEVLDMIPLRKELLPEVVMTGYKKGRVTDEMAHEIGLLKEQIPEVIATAQHDSASAAYVTPAGEQHMFIISGTWSIIGVVLDQPVITEKVYDYGFSNEGAAFGKVKLVKSIMGTWLIQELRHRWKKRGWNTDYEFLVKEADRAEAFRHYIDVDHELFVAPSDMEEAILEYCKLSGQDRIVEQGAFYRTIMESLAFQYQIALEDLEEITGKKIETIQLLGGAVQDWMFCQFIANATGRAVYAGPVEATAAGSALIQLQAKGVVKDEHEKDQIIKRSFDISKYVPQDRDVWEKMGKKYRENIRRTRRILGCANSK